MSASTKTSVSAVTTGDISARSIPPNLRIDIVTEVSAAHVQSMTDMYQHEFSAGTWPSRKQLSDVQRMIKSNGANFLAVIATLPTVMSTDTSSNCAAIKTSDANAGVEQHKITANINDAAVHNRQLIAFSTVCGNLRNDPLIEDVIVSPAYRALGLGRRMLTTIFQAARENPLLLGARCFELYCRPAVAPFYERVGFVHVRAPINDKCFMRFTLSAASISSSTKTP